MLICERSRESFEGGEGGGGNYLKVFFGSGKSLPRTMSGPNLSRAERHLTLHTVPFLSGRRLSIFNMTGWAATLTENSLHSKPMNKEPKPVQKTFHHHQVLISYLASTKGFRYRFHPPSHSISPFHFESTKTQNTPLPLVLLLQLHSLKHTQLSSKSLK